MLRTALAAAVLTLGGLSPATAALVDRTFTVTATNTGGAIQTFQINFSLTYDTVPTAETTTGISLISASAGWSGTLGFLVNSLGQVVIGGTENGVTGLGEIPNDVLFTMDGAAGTPSVSRLQYVYSPMLVIIGRFGDSSSVNVTFVENASPATAVPEPGTLALLGTAVLGLAAARRRKAGA